MEHDAEPRLDALGVFICWTFAISFVLAVGFALSATLVGFAVWNFVAIPYNVFSTLIGRQR